MLKNNAPKIAILILNWNNYPDTKACLESLEILCYQEKEIVLVDNGSNDGSTDMLRREFPEITFLPSDRNLGFAGGNNIGLRYILDKQIPYTLLLNNDTEVISPDFLDDLLGEIRVGDWICAVGPKVTRLDGTADQVILPFPTLDNIFRTSLGLYHPQLDKKQTVDSLAGCCVMINNNAIRQTGLLDGNYFMYVEETEWFFRMRMAGWKLIYLPVDSVLHKGGASARKLESRKVYIERRANVVYTLVKHNYLLQGAAAAGLMTILLLGRIIGEQFNFQSQKRANYRLSMIIEMVRAFSSKWKLALDH